MAKILDDLKFSFQSGNMVTRFIYINIAVFVFLSLIRVFGYFYQSDLLGVVLPWISGSSVPQTMLFRPWTIISYMFVHVGLWHLVVNMIMLWFSGRLFGDLLNDRRFIAVYFLGGIAGFLLYFIAYNAFPVFSGTESTLIGASASVIAVLVAIATYAPEMVVRLVLIGRVKLKFIAIFFVALDILFLDGGNSGGRLAHLGGALFGFLYARNLASGRDWSNGFFKVIDFFGELFRPKPKLRVASSNKKRRGTRKTQTRSKEVRSEKSSQKRIDEILDKISQSGYDSLSKEEKEFLFNASNK